MSGGATIDGLRREWPSWEPWLAVVEETLREAAGSRWDPFVPELPASRPGLPLLAGVPIAPDAALACDWVVRLFAAAAPGRPSPEPTIPPDIGAGLDAERLFAAALRQDAHGLGEAAARAGTDAARFQAIAALVPVPFLHACTRRLASSVPAGWGEGYCPVCGAWPAFAEVLGSSRERRLRCGRCGGAWNWQPLCCPYCTVRNHELLTTLAPTGSEAASRGTLEACEECRGYLKTLTFLEGCTQAGVILEDLATVDLDLAALQQGYRRPAGTGCALGLLAV